MDSRYIMMILEDGSSYIIPTEERHLIPTSVSATIDLKFYPITSGSAWAKRQHG